MSGNHSKRPSMKLKLVIVGLLTVCASLAIVAFVAVSNSSRMEPSQPINHKRSMEPQENQDYEVKFL